MEENQQTEPLCDFAKFVKLVGTFKISSSIITLLEQTNWDISCCIYTIEETTPPASVLKEIFEKTYFNIEVCKAIISILPSLNTEDKLIIFNIPHENCANTNHLDEIILLRILERTNYDEGVVSCIESYTEIMQNREQQEEAPNRQKDSADCDGSCCDCC